MASVSNIDLSVDSYLYPLMECKLVLSYLSMEQRHRGFTIIIDLSESPFEYINFSFDTLDNVKVSRIEKLPLL